MNNFHFIPEFPKSNHFQYDQQENRPRSKVEFFISPFLVVGEFAYWNVV